jgi:hypothetical protein
VQRITGRCFIRIKVVKGSAINRILYRKLEKAQMSEEEIDRVYFFCMYTG